MTALTALWLPILLSAVAVFLASSVIHMAPLWHKSDYPKVPDEDRLMNALRPLAIPPGDYLVPRVASAKDLQTPEYKEKIAKGPVLMLTMLPNTAFNMARNLGLWFAYVLIVSALAGYVAGSAYPAGAAAAAVCRMVCVTAFIAYVVALWQMSIWYWRGWDLTLKATLDGAIYAALTGGIFAWLWP